MLQEEPDVTREERTAIVEPRHELQAGWKDYINQAATKDLEAALEISS